MTEYRSKRLQCLRDKNRESKSRPSFLGDINANNQQEEEKKLGYFWAYWDLVVKLIHILYVWTSGSARKLVDCLLGITCHEQEEVSWREGKQETYFQLLQSSCHPQETHSPTPLFSSDDDEVDDRSCTRECPEDLISDNELPLVRLIDSTSHLVNLWNTNQPAFICTVKSGIQNWVCNQHNNQVEPTNVIGGKVRRSKVVNNIIGALKRREYRKRMTRLQEDDYKAKVRQFALTSRILVFVIQGLTYNLGSAWKHENDGFKFTPEYDYGKWLDPLVNSTFGGYVNWDGHYFLHISVHGYTSENMLAFFPLLPMLLYLPSRVAFLLLGYVMSLSSIVIVAGVLFNTWIFVKCAENIYELTKLWSGGGSHKLTLTASLFFIFNPASIFFNGLYTETLYAYLTSSVLLALFNQNTLAAIVYAGLSTLCRSNGILNCGFIVAYSLQQQLLDKKRRFHYFPFVFCSVIQGVLCTFPFYLFQLYGINQFCENKLYDAHPDHIPLYCLKSSWGLPYLPYSYVQRKYWDVGFLRYFKIKQIPNFLLAFPVLCVLGRESLHVLKRTARNMIQQSSFQGLYFSLQAVHGIFMVLFCFFFVHVQVSTRMIMSACPYLYAYMADSFLLDVEKFRSREISVPVRPLLMLQWCTLYFVIGTILFSLGLPWT